nr:DUF2612 domain-containing structural protein [Rhizobium phage RHph_TM26]
MSCVDESVLVEERMDRVLTQYRESPNLLFMIRTYLYQVTKIYSAICDMPSFFSLYSAVGDQLTLIGKRMGFPRCHCICDIPPVFGFACADQLSIEQQIMGFCEGVTWQSCTDADISEICVSDDEMYRKLLIARSYQMQSFYSHEDLTAALQVIFGPTARILDGGNGRVVLAPFRELTDDEVALMQVIPRVLPIAPGINVRWHFGTRIVFGFGFGWGGFCEEYLPDGEALLTEDGEVITDENDDPIMTGPLTQGADWMCEIDVKPYSC